MPTWRIIQGDVTARLRELPDESVHCVVTSPPYWGLRDYGTGTWDGGDPACEHVGSEARTVSGGPGKQYTNVGSNAVYSGDCKCGARRIDQQLGLERSPEEYVEKMVGVFREVRRVLRSDGTAWVNMGDCYTANGGGGESRMIELGHPSENAIHAHAGLGQLSGRTGSKRTGLKPKNLVGMPWRLAFALQADGWWLRSAITWCKRAPMPESVTDRPTSATEMIFLLAKSASYFFDQEAVREPMAKESAARYAYAFSGTKGADDVNDRRTVPAGMREPAAGRNLRNFWLLGPEPLAEPHFAAFPSEIPRRAILAGTSAHGVCSACGAPWERVVESVNQDRSRRTGCGVDSAEGTAGRAGTLVSRTTGWRPTCAHEAPVVAATVLDPFSGSGTTGVMALRLGRSFVGIELSPAYAEMSRRRLSQAAPLFAEETEAVTRARQGEIP